MRKLLAAILCLFSLSVTAQTAEEIVQKYGTYMGGLDRFNAVKSAKITGTFTSQGNDFPMTIYIINGKAVRSEIDVMGSEVVNSYKDGKGWKINPFAGSTDPVDMTASELIENKAQVFLANSLMDYKARGHEIELLGKEDVEGKPAYKVKLTTKDDKKVTTYYIDAQTYSLIKSETERDLGGQTMLMETWYSALKDFNGVKFYLARVQKISGEEVQSSSFSNIELNPTIDEKIFDKP